MAAEIEWLRALTAGDAWLRASLVAGHGLQNLLVQVGDIHESEQGGGRFEGTNLLHAHCRTGFRNSHDSGASQDPIEMPYEEIKRDLKNHLVPEPSLVTERYKFQCFRQKLGQSVSKFIVELQKCASTCKFNEISRDYRKDRLCDQQIFGLVDERLRSKLLAEKA